ncbi:MAG: hypothetical protein ACYC6M_10530 [Terriglobales bacterium]
MNATLGVRIFNTPPMRGLAITRLIPMLEVSTTATLTRSLFADTLAAAGQRLGECVLFSVFHLFAFDLLLRFEHDHQPEGDTFDDLHTVAGLLRPRKLLAPHLAAAVRPLSIPTGNS